MFAPRLRWPAATSPTASFATWASVDAPEFTPGGTVRSPLKGAGCAGVEFVAAKGARSFPRQQGVARVQVEPMEVYTPSSGYYSDTDCIIRRFGYPRVSPQPSRRISVTTWMGPTGAQLEGIEPSARRGGNRRSTVRAPARVKLGACRSLSVPVPNGALVRTRARTRATPAGNRRTDQFISSRLRCR